jgi:histidinol dehydrogenase
MLELSEPAMEIARAEGLGAHAQAVKRRLRAK